MSRPEIEATVHWKVRAEMLEHIRQLERIAETKKKESERELATHFGIKQAMIKRHSNCDSSPIGRCVTNPNAENPWICLYCENE